MDGLRAHGVPFLEFEGAVVEAAWQAEAVFGEGALAGEVAAIHGAELGDCLVALVGEDDGIVGQVFEERGRRLAGFAAREIAGIVLNTVAGASRLEHFEVEIGALFNALGFEEFALIVEGFDGLLELVLNAIDGLIEGRARGDIVGVRVDFDLLKALDFLAGERVEFRDVLDLVAEEGDFPGAVFIVGGEDVDDVALHAESAAAECGVVALVLEVDKVFRDLAGVDALAGLQLEGHGGVGLDRANTVNAGDRGDDDHIVPLEQRTGGRVAHPVDGLVDGALFLDIGVGARDVGFGLVIVVIRNKKLHRVFREEVFEFAIELGSERLVWREDERRALSALDDVRHGEGLARAGDAEQDLVELVFFFQAGDKFVDRLGLVAGGLVLGVELEGDPAFGLLPFAFRTVRRPVDGVQHFDSAVHDELGCGGFGKASGGGFGHAANMAARAGLFQCVFRRLLTGFVSSSVLQPG